MASPTPSLGQGLLLFCELYAGALVALAFSLFALLVTVRRRERKRNEEV
ncbi:hypothetical protein OIU34_19565 [Pararhizobium sp. BT-229]|nr:hypothetical protein [Pararhizobium sp. BT-229]MCV9964083.1 hypothetical protein [Pararhizobium sp. BT-229]